MSRCLVQQALGKSAIAAVLAFAALYSHAVPVAVSPLAVSFAAGAGYGPDANETNGTLLGASFSSIGFEAQDFELSEAGDSYTFTVGSIRFFEPNSHGGINGNEVGDLGVTARIDFGSLLGSAVQITGFGAATGGAVNDAAIDLSLIWQPVQAAFGAGGLLEIALNRLDFSATSTTLLQTATVTLVNAPAATTASFTSTVPEPASLALVGAALAGLAVTRRRRG
jgi:hypothetical protein